MPNQVATTSNLSRYEAWAEISGEKIPVVTLDCDYALNTIPICQLQLPVGKDPVTGKTLPDVFKLRDPVKVYVKEYVAVSSGNKHKASFGSDAICIFEGMLATWGMNISSTGVTNSINVNHWAAELDEYPLFNPAIYCGSIGDLYTAAFRDSSGALTSAVSQTFYNFISLKSEASISNMIKSMLTEIIHRNQQTIKQSRQKISEWFDANDFKRALELIGKLNTAVMPSKTGNTSSKPCPLTLPDEITTEQAAQYMSYLGSQRAAGTIWEVLLMIASEFQFLLAPTRTSINFAPIVMPFAKDKATIKITRDEIFLLNPSMAGARSIGAVYLVSDSTVSNPTNTIEETYLGAYRDLKNKGAPLMLPAPSLLNTYCSVLSQQKKPDQINVTAGVSKKQEPQMPNDNLDTTFGGKYAKMKWATHSVLPWTATLHMRPTLDCGPGTAVRLELPSITESTSLSASKTLEALGVVGSWKLYISAEKSMASTVLTLNGFRLGEDAISRYSLDEHPIYKEIYKGCQIQQ